MNAPGADFRSAAALFLSMTVCGLGFVYALGFELRNRVEERQRCECDAQRQDCQRSEQKHQLDDGSISRQKVARAASHQEQSKNRGAAQSFGLPPDQGVEISVFPGDFDQPDLPCPKGRQE